MSHQHVSASVHATCCHIYCVFHFALSEVLPTQIGGYCEERDSVEETRFLLYHISIHSFIH